MQAYEVTQKLLSFGPAYEVRAAGSDQVLMTAKGKLLTASPKLTMTGADGSEIASMNGNFTRTKFTIQNAQKQDIGVLTFPLIAFKKSFSLTVGQVEYKAEGGIMARDFKILDGQGQLLLEISKELALRDKFSVKFEPVIPDVVAFLCAVAIDQKFFQEE